MKPRCNSANAIPERQYFVRESISLAEVSFRVLDGEARGIDEEASIREA